MAYNDHTTHQHACDCREAEFAALKAKLAKKEKDYEALMAQRDELIEALQSLYDEQNGPPLIREEKHWKEAMDKAEKALKGDKE
jgi:hypothetical protein